MQPTVSQMMSLKLWARTRLGDDLQNGPGSSRAKKCAVHVVASLTPQITDWAAVTEEIGVMLKDGIVNIQEPYRAMVVSCYHAALGNPNDAARSALEVFLTAIFNQRP